MTEASIKLTDVSKTFDTGKNTVLTALSDIDLAIAPGEFVALIGPSGCGKSTLLRMVAALEEPTTGTITVGDTAPAVLAQKHKLGVAFQEHALLPWLTVSQNVALLFQLAGRPVDAGRVQQLIDLVGLKGFEKARPKQLSGGMRQRASIARSLTLNPSLLLLDEPFGALDAVTRRQLNIELQNIWAKERVTTLLVTHGVDEALFLADRVVVLESHPGRIREVVDVPFERPRTPELLRAPEFHALVDRLTEALHPGGVE